MLLPKSLIIGQFTPIYQSQLHTNTIETDEQKFTMSHTFVRQRLQNMHVLIRYIISIYFLQFILSINGD